MLKIETMVGIRILHIPEPELNLLKAQVKLSLFWKFSIAIPPGWDYLETKTTQSNVPLRILSPLNYETVDIYKTDLKDNFRENVSIETMNIDNDSIQSFYNVTFNTFKSYYDSFLEQEKGQSKDGKIKWFIFQFVGNGEL